MTSLELAREIPDSFFIEAGFSERQLDGFQKEALKRSGVSRRHKWHTRS